MSETPAWEKLAGMAMAAANRGDSQTAMELGYAAHDAYMNHCQAAYGQDRARQSHPAHSVWIRDWERERSR